LVDIYDKIKITNDNLQILIVYLYFSKTINTMRIFNLLFLFFIFITISIKAQDVKSNDLPYYQIPDYPVKFTAGTVAARVVDGLGFRYYWATEGLREVDLNYKSNDSARTTLETIDHIYGLSKVIVNATRKKVNDFTVEQPKLTYIEKRYKTLENIKQASEILKVASADEMEKFIIIFRSKNSTSEYPFWNNLNGPIADAIWHTGQVVLLRRSSGNPFNSKASLLRGKLRD